LALKKQEGIIIGKASFEAAILLHTVLHYQNIYRKLTANLFTLFSEALVIASFNYPAACTSHNF
jgi:hypothetical protein